MGSAQERVRQALEQLGTNPDHQHAHLILTAIKYNDKPHKWVESGAFPSPAVGLLPA